MEEETSDIIEEEHTLFEDDVDPNHKVVPVSQQLVVLSLILLVIFSSGVITKIVAYLDQKNESQTAGFVLPEVVETNEAGEQSFDDFSDIQITAQSAFVYDVNEDEVLFEKNSDEQLPLASLTKLMTALVAHELLANKETIKISSDAVNQDGESSLLLGNEFTLENISDLTLISSSNDGAFAMANAVGALLDQNKPTESFIQAMNIKADELGLKQTYFRNPTGLDVSETEAGAYGSARDIAELFKYILERYPGIIEKTTESNATFRDEDGSVHNVDNTNQAVKNIPGIIGSKTGYTTLAGGNLAIAFAVSLNRPVIIVALGSTRNGRFSDVLKLSDRTRALVTNP